MQQSLVDARSLDFPSFPANSPSPVGMKFFVPVKFEGAVVHTSARCVSRDCLVIFVWEQFGCEVYLIKAHAYLSEPECIEDHM